MGKQHYKVAKQMNIIWGTLFVCFFVVDFFKQAMTLDSARLDLWFCF